MSAEDLLASKEDELLDYVEGRNVDTDELRDRIVRIQNPSPLFVFCKRWPEETFGFLTTPKLRKNPPE